MNQRSKGSKTETTKSRPEVLGEQMESGHMTDPELIQEDTNLERAKEAGLYENQDEEHPGELNVAEEIEKDEKKR